MTAWSITAVVSVLSAPLSAQWLNHPIPGIPRTADGKPNLTAPAPRTPDGKPDLSGLWQRISPKYSRNVAADLKPGEVQPWADALYQHRLDDFGKDHMAYQCLPWGPNYSNSERRTKIIQTPSLIVLLDEDLTYRQIFMDGRKLETDANPSWMGYSVGHWDGTRWWLTATDSMTGRGSIATATPTARRCARPNATSAGTSATWILKSP